MLAIILLLKVM